MRGNVRLGVGAILLFASNSGCGQVADLGHNAHALGGAGAQAGGSGGARVEFGGSSGEVSRGGATGRGGTTGRGGNANGNGGNTAVGSGGSSQGGAGLGGSTGGSDSMQGGSAGTPVTEPQPPGWSLRDSTPYPRAGSLAIIDEDADRLILFGGGGGNDLWELALSGPRQGQWNQLRASGDAPLISGDTWNLDSAIYDPFGRRMLVLVHDAGHSDLLTPIWELSLGGAPVWNRLVSSRVTMDEAVFGRLTLDRAGKRALMIGGWGLPDSPSTAWSLSLEGEMRWEKLAEVEVDVTTYQIFDPKRRQLVVLGGPNWRGEVSALSLDDSSWNHLRVAGSDFPILVATPVLDAEHDRILMASADESLWAFSLATNEMTKVSPARSVGAYAGVTADERRGRILYFSGRRGNVVDNGVRALTVDDLSLSTAVEATRQALPISNSTEGPPNIPGMQTVVWDPIRQKVLGINVSGDDSAATFERGLSPDDEWTPRATSETPVVTGANTVYDREVGAALIFGGERGCCATSELYRLPSGENAAWEHLRPDFAEVPTPRSGVAGVYDSNARRFVIFGGRDNPWVVNLNDTWSISLTENAAWQKLDTSGELPSERHSSAAVYDPPGKRMLIYGGFGNDDLYSLSLDQEPFTWTRLAPAGTWPGTNQPSGALSAPVAVYDADSRRMLIVNMDFQHNEVFALELSPELRWHRFCEGPLSPAYYGPVTRAVLTPEGIYISGSGGSFIFNIQTPYCD